MRVLNNLQDDLRDAYEKLAAFACEQIASIRTIVSLHREEMLLAEFVFSMNAPVRKMMISTAKSIFVSLCLSIFDTSISRSVKELHSLSMRCYSDIKAGFWLLENIRLFNSLFA
jgi:hypothetical protein